VKSTEAWPIRIGTSTITTPTIAIQKADQAHAFPGSGRASAVTATK
jgi:hypothetical protein